MGSYLLIVLVEVPVLVLEHHEVLHLLLADPPLLPHLSASQPSLLQHWEHCPGPCYRRGSYRSREWASSGRSLSPGTRKVWKIWKEKKKGKFVLWIRNTFICWKS